MTAPMPDIASLIPHAGSMVLLEEIVEHDAEHIVLRTATHRNPANPLRFDGRLSARAGIEYGAQAAAVHGGLMGRDGAGYLSALRDVTLHVDTLDDIPGDLTVRATQVLSDARFVVYAFSLEDETGRTVVEGQATIFLTAEAEQGQTP